MIVPHELRIGNFVEVENYEIIQLENIHPKGTTKGDEIYLSSMLKPIELSEHWLLKFGLKNTETGWEYIYGHSNRISVILFKKFASVGISGPFGLIHVQVKYVNQFQNLTFAITGEELKIKES